LRWNFCTIAWNSGVAAEDPARCCERYRAFLKKTNLGDNEVPELNVGVENSSETL
jgi:hypothetical protein